MFIIFFLCLLLLLFANECFSFIVHHQWIRQLKNCNAPLLKYTKNPYSQPEPGPKNVSAILSPINRKDDREMIFLPRSDFEDLLGISDERDKLLLERADLLLRLAELTNQSVQHLASLAKKDIEIEELRRENLKMRISSLESQVSQQAAEILHLQAHVSRQATKTEYETFITALQDSNSIYQLEEDSPGMFDLRQLQNKFSHFITNHDSPELVNYKISILITKLQKDMSVACQPISASFWRNVYKRCSAAPIL